MEVRNLRAYCANIGVTLKEFCEGIDCDPVYMSSVINGRAIASRRLAKDVWDATDGTIMLETRLRKRHKKQDDGQNDQQECG